MAPNILLITSDQQHWNTIGAFNPEIQTPNLDRLVREGTTFTRAYCTNPTCTPSRSSILTGTYPSQHGAWSLGTKLMEDRHTVGDDFQSAGYRTALVGKAHFQPTASTAEFPSIESMPLLHNFDHWKSFHGPYYGFGRVELTRNHTNEFLVGQHYALWLEEQGCKDWRKYFTPPIGQMDPKDEFYWDIPEEFHYDTWIAERVSALIQEYHSNNDRFFIWASFHDPHPPYLVPSPWDQMYDPESLTIPTVNPGEHDKNPPHFQLTQEVNPDFSPWKESGMYIHGYHSHLRYTEGERKQLIATYYAMISLMDKYIGKILDKLDELNITEETLVVFTSDHGHLFGQHGMYFKGGFHYEDLIKVPFIVRYPGQVPDGRICSSLQSLVDLSPTLLDLSKLSIPRSMTGVSQSQVWTGAQEAARDHVLCEFHHEPTTIHQVSYVEADYKLTVYRRQTYGELFDLKNDPNEINNLWFNRDYAELRSTLLLKLSWANLSKDSMPMPRISGA